MEAPNAATNSIANKISGNAKIPSIVLITRPSTMPFLIPANRPSGTPIIIDISIALTDIKIAICEP